MVDRRPFKPIIPAAELMALARAGKAKRRKERLEREGKEVPEPTIPTPYTGPKRGVGRPKGVKNKTKRAKAFRPHTVVWIALAAEDNRLETLRQTTLRLRKRYYKYLVNIPLVRALLDDSGDKVVLAPGTILTHEILDSLTIDQIAMLDVEEGLRRAIEIKMGHFWETIMKHRKAKIPGI